MFENAGYQILPLVGGKLFRRSEILLVKILKNLVIQVGSNHALLGHPLKCGFYSLFWILNKSFNGCPCSSNRYWHIIELEHAEHAQTCSMITFCP